MNSWTNYIPIFSILFSAAFLLLSSVIFLINAFESKDTNKRYALLAISVIMFIQLIFILFNNVFSNVLIFDFSNLSD